MGISEAVFMKSRVGELRGGVMGNFVAPMLGRVNTGYVVVTMVGLPGDEKYVASMGQ